MSNLKLCLEFYSDITSLLATEKYRRLTPPDAVFTFGYAAYMINKMVQDVVDERLRDWKKEMKNEAPPPH